MTASTTHRALDGVGYRIAGDLDLSRPATSVAQLAVGNRIHELTSGGSRLGDDVAESLDIADFDSEYAFGDGVLRFAAKTEYDPQTELVEEPLLVVWQGRRHSLVTRLYRQTESEIMGMLRRLGIRESAEGLSLHPDNAAGVGFAGPATVIKEIPGLGLLEMAAPTAEQTAQLPPWKGVDVKAGELYRDTLADGKPFFVLSTPQVWATLVPLADTVLDDVPRLADALTLHVDG
ncbi:hypothetical protein LX16_4329 [Stackebrandtia albiflava]|uniref:Uncharacterized protein n=1 Tax=Stackebrandtia albiflava TaxID=406432 RepID=A0A562UR67_9ACTN|nr:hypothetical protein [Stackebrandtia albiflava]TWJ08109.1 hypothetical protein LX16_4329 [Stackebrandtia albiflava]